MKFITREGIASILIMIGMAVAGGWLIMQVMDAAAASRAKMNEINNFCFSQKMVVVRLRATDTLYCADYNSLVKVK